MKKFWTDIDSTLTDHWKRIRKWTRPQWPGDTVDSRCWTREEVQQDRLLPMAGAVLRCVRDKGYEIGYLTARGYGDARNITLEQLKQLGVPDCWNVKIVSTMADKVEFLRQNPVDFYVDDFTTGQEHSIPTFRRETAEAIQALGIKVIVFRNDWEDVWEQFQLLSR